MNNVVKWCENLRDYWINKDIDNILNLFDKDVIYYEAPNEKLDSFDEISIAWNDIESQNTNDIKMKILCKENNKCIANFILKDGTICDMIYEIELNDANKCIYFKQWYMEF